MKIWDLLRAKVIHKFDVPFRPPVTQNCGSPATALAFSPDGSRLATGMPDGTILLWRVPNLAHSTLATDKLDELWRELVGQDDAKGWRAAWQLSEDPTSATELIQRMLKPAAVYDAKAVEQWIGQLDHADFRVREAAMKRLQAVVDQDSRRCLPRQQIRMTFHRKSDGAQLAICRAAAEAGPAAADVGKRPIAGYLGARKHAHRQGKQAARQFGFRCSERLADA